MYRPRSRREVQERRDEVSRETREMRKAPEKIRKHDATKYKEKDPHVTHQADLFFLPRDQQREITLTNPKDIERFGGRTKIKAKGMLIVQDVGSRLFDIKWIPNKTAPATEAAIKQIYSENILKKPRFRLITDAGKEFKASFHQYVENDLKVRHSAKDSAYSHLGVVDRKIQAFRDEGDKKLEDWDNVTHPNPQDPDFDWERFRKQFIRKENKRTEDAYTPPKDPKIKHVRLDQPRHHEILPIGTKVKRYINYDIIRDADGHLKKQIGTRSEVQNRAHWTRHNYIIVNVLLNPDSPPRYILKREGRFQPENNNPVHYKHVKPLRVFRQQEP